MSDKEWPAVNIVDLIAYVLHSIVDSLGVNRPIRLGLALALTLFLAWPARLVSNAFPMAVPTNDTELYLFLFGLSFCVLFIPVLFSDKSVPEPTKEIVNLIEIAAKRGGLSYKEKKAMYVELCQGMLRVVSPKGKMSKTSNVDRPETSTIDISRVEKLLARMVSFESTIKNRVGSSSND